MRYGVVDADNDLVHFTDVPLPGPRLPHDMAFTENYAILNDFPLFWDPKLLAADVHLPGFHRDMPSRFAVIPRRADPRNPVVRGRPDVRAALGQRYEDGDEIVLDGFFEGEPNPVDTLTGDKYKKAFRYLALDGLQTHLHRWRFNLVTGEAREEQLSDSTTEFGMINGGYAGGKYRYTYAATGKPGWFLFDGLVKHDLEDRYRGTVRIRRRGVRQRDRDGAARREHRGGRRLPGDADHRHERRRLVLPGVRAARVADGPVCKLALPERISSGTHSTWAPGRSCGAGATPTPRPARSACRCAAAAPTPSPACWVCSATSGRCLSSSRRCWVQRGTATSRRDCHLEFGADGATTVADRRGTAGSSGLPVESAAVEYVITERGRSLWPVLVSIWEWERRWVPDHADPCRDAPQHLRRRLHPVVTCGSCGEAASEKDVVAQWGPSGSWPRSIPWPPHPAAFRVRSGRRVVPADDERDGQPLGFRDSGRGVRRLSRFTDFQTQLGAPPGSIADRLSIFTANGVFEMSDNRYRLTEKGRALFPVLVTALQWAQRWYQAPEGPAVILTHTGCGGRFDLVLTCDQCSEPTAGRAVHPRRT